jgi:transferrin binding protein
MAQAMRATAIWTVIAMLSACGGGGGVIATGPSSSEVHLATFAAVAPNQTVVMEASSAALSGTLTTSGGITSITSVERSPLGSATVRFGYDSARELSNISISTPQGTFSFDRNAPGHSVDCSGRICSAENPSANLLTIDPIDVGWNYQSFGVWGTDLNQSSWKLGAISFGSPTNGSSVPTVGSATFTGIATGFYTDLGGTLYGTTANMRADVSFGSRSIQFSTSNTGLLNSNTSARSTDNGLNLSGMLGYAQGVNSFSGPVLTQNNLLGGQAAGKFYGPSAEEIGGVYSLRGTSIGSMVGGFGGKR